MRGFKSFADPTVLEFEPGVTVVVGPNGSGKSNVVDAVTWVLGAQGPRQLRSAKMEDVIFAGTASRPALGRAEVSLTIDNATGDLAIDTAEVTITRTLFRNGDSEYALNGTPCRLLDIQELLSDTGIGRSQHMIIGQGQLDAVLQARPEERRAIIEEAAGVLKHRRRRERAERRLAQTQENLERLGDLVREVRRQMRPLERQAHAARNHAGLAADLREVRIFVAGQELAELTSRRDAAEVAAQAIATEAETLRQEIAALDTEAASAAAELSSRREEDLASLLASIQGLAARARGTISLLVERHRAVLVALDANADVDVVSNLETEAARITEDLERLVIDRAAIEPEEREVISADADLVQAEAGIGREDAQATLRAATAAHAAARAKVEEAQRLVAERTRAVGLAQSRVSAAESRVAKRIEADELLATQLDEARRRAGETTAAADAATAALDMAERRLTSAEAALQAASDRSHRSAARHEALAKSLDDLEGSAGRAALEGLAGVVGALVDLVEIDEGWERAIEAAAGAAVGAMVVDGRDAARSALQRLREQGAAGLVLAPGAVTQPFDTLPTKAAPLRTRIRPRRGTSSEVERVLDTVFARAVLVEAIEDAMELSLDRPDLVVVTMSGDRFSTSGWRVQSTTGVVTRAAVEAAAQTADDDRAAATSASLVANDARDQASTARTTHAEATRSADRSAAQIEGLQRQIAAAHTERVEADAGLVAAREELVEAQAAADEASATISGSESGDDAHEAAIAAAREELAAADARAASAAELRSDVDRRRRALAVAKAAIDERQRVLERRRAEIERRLEGHAAEREEAAARRQHLDATGRALLTLKDRVIVERDRLDGLVTSLTEAYQTQLQAVRAGGARLEVLRQRRADLERRSTDLGTRQRSTEVDAAEVALRLSTLGELIERELGASAAEVLSATCPELPDGVSATSHAANLAAKLQGLGPINPLALEELAALEERHRELDEQVSDVRSARRDLQQVIGDLDEEIVTSFASAYADVNEHFSTLVAMLFPGGTGRLSLVDPDDLLNTGVEIEVRPAGRNVRRVSLLSGGERSMAALAFSFAVFRSRPSPFYLMDEVEAALDDVNLHRFLGLIDEFREEAQLIVVSHQKRTMESGDALYGVTMAPGGSSQVVSQRVVRTRPDAQAEDPR